MIKRGLHIVCQEHGSLNEVINGITPSLKQGFVVTREDFNTPLFSDVLLMHHLIPECVTAPEFDSFKFKILIQPVDGTVIKNKYVDLINKFDLIITPSTSGLNLLRSNGVIVKIIIIPNFKDDYSDTLIGDYSQTACSVIDNPTNKFIFYHESTLSSRKGFEDLCEVYLDAFATKELYDKVLLVIKGPEFTESNVVDLENVKKKIIIKQNRLEYCPQIIKISQNLPLEKRKQLMWQSNAYVSLSRFEGFGIPLLNAASLNKPIIASNSLDFGSLDFIPKKYLYRSYLSSQKENTGWLYDEKSEWYYPFKQDVVKIMQDVYYNHTNNTYINPDYEIYSKENVGKMYVDLISKSLKEQETQTI